MKNLFIFKFKNKNLQYDKNIYSKLVKNKINIIKDKIKLLH